ncbi:MAG: hypothetical protein COX80_01490 [Candidatus Magasanikbacteria bacterium CG_4_10_14_0_2_um_filter_33_14]|uniref:Uncharacterized protein n=1 Tax=Candidatus Magasanikbacteria bacterium CG_4_10_14_0_2_um_filter_33_14 TaxID=1974636 RepID=A0A2M7VBF8_9BACT|nr:MAG: hypothetical protein COX80_01490 [Candidatus Magasanikbacteria bacterium CG_4_10_14_0_2_um_filter_33_14]
MKIFRDWSFKWWEVALLKVCLISLGILMGLYFFKYLVALTWLWWGLFVVIGLYFMVRFFRGK